MIGKFLGPMAMLLALSVGGSAYAEPARSVTEGRSVAQDCEPAVEVCGVMSPYKLVSFADRCAAQSAGARRILVGPCDDAD